MFILKLARLTLTLLILTVLAISFQNCSKPKFNSVEDSQKLLRSENGGPYGGKVGEFRHYSQTEACRTLDLKGKPLPNEMVLIRAKASGGIGPFLTREACQDIEPVAIPDAEVQYDEATGSLTYRNQTYSNQDKPGDFDIVAASCPLGRTAIPNALRQNSVAFTYDWNSLQTLQNGVWSPGWYHQPGIGVALYSTISSLPAFLLQRNDPNFNEEWRRSSQHLYLNANTEYAFSFLAQPGSLNAADFTFYRGLTGIAGDPRNEEVVIQFDFQNQSTSTVRNTNMPNVRASIRPFGNGFLCTVYFTTSATGHQGESSVGVAPSTLNQSTGQVGDSILATAAQLVPVDQFCR